MPSGNENQHHPSMGLRFAALKYAFSNKLKLWYDRLPSPVQKTYVVLKTSVQYFIAHDTSQLGSSLSYYMIFSLAPMLIIIISITGSIFGREAVTGQLKGQIESLLGSNTAAQLQDMVKAAYQPGKNGMATIVSLVLLLIGATQVFDQLRTSLNTIWDLKAAEKKPFWRYLIDRLFSFGMIVVMAFLLLVSLVINTALAAVSGWLSSRMADISNYILMPAEFVFSLAVTAALFMLIFRFMSDIKVKWKHAWWGALFTAVLFAIGKYGISLYISGSHLANTYGAASSVVVVLVWVFYSSQILFFGAEFTRVLADQKHSSLDTKGTVREKPEVKED